MGGHLRDIWNTFQRTIKKTGQKSKGKSKVKSKDKVIHLIAEKSKITVPEIAEDLGLSLAGVEKIIRTLKQEKRLYQVGPAKGGYWEVVE